jgi:hypothetical protein
VATPDYILTDEASELHAVCRLESHLLGWQLLLETEALLSRSQAYRSSDEVLDLCEHWRAVNRRSRVGVIAEGWTVYTVLGQA